MSAPTDVLLLCWRDTGHPQGGGSERYLERVGAEFAARGSRVTLLTARYPGAPRTQMLHGMRVIRAGGRLTVYPRALATIAAARFGRGRLAGYRPDVVVDTQNGVPFFARLVTSAPTVVLVHHCHREQWPVAGKLLAKVGWRIESRLSPRVHRDNRYVTVSVPSKAELVDLGVDAERITVVRGGIDPVPEGIVPEPNPGGFRLIALSRLVPHKQVEDALAVVARLSESGVDSTLDVVGDGWWADRLRTHVQALGVEDRVRFHGHVSERRKHELLAGADLHLMPSRKEGWGLAVIEAAQHGVPTVGYASSAGLTDSIVDGATGVLVDDVDELAEVAADLAKDAERRRELGAAARARSVQFLWSETADGFARVFEL
ncbi:glycosyltransferase family 4 protein [Gordonia sp. (in: high G+C Gram-positive bacteria)]|uniref:glycosyltransferase family 4 protein n=1 Tax=Gordonia sp. (in: high G+C Gram-positive bacteria) TaxID=84139 RepID=UPI003C70A1EE